MAVKSAAYSEALSSFLEGGNGLDALAPQPAVSAAHDVGGTDSQHWPLAGSNRRAGVQTSLLDFSSMPATSSTALTVPFRRKMDAETATSFLAGQAPRSRVAWVKDAALDVQRLQLWKEMRRSLVRTMKRRSEAEIFGVGALLGGAVLLTSAMPLTTEKPAAKTAKSEDPFKDLDPVSKTFQVRRQQGPPRSKVFPGSSRRSGNSSGSQSSSGSGGGRSRKGGPRGEVSEADSALMPSQRYTLQPCLEATAEEEERAAIDTVGDEGQASEAPSDGGFSH